MIKGPHLETCNNNKMKNNMNNKFYFNLSFQVIAIFSIIIFCSFIPDTFPAFFGDWICHGRTYVPSANAYSSGHYINCDIGSGEHNPSLHWGYRHYLFVSMGISLFLIQFVRLIKYIQGNS